MVIKIVPILFNEFYWNGKLLVFTWHFKEELNALRKPLEFVLDVLDKGEHVLVSKNQNKYNVFYPFRGKYLCLSYVEHENVILIHIKPTGKKLEVK
jgi:hypothetical protein